MVNGGAFMESPVIVRVKRIDKKKDGAWYLMVRDHHGAEYSVRTKDHTIKKTDKGRYAEIDFGRRGFRFMRMVHKNQVPRYAL